MKYPHSITPALIAFVVSCVCERKPQVASPQPMVPASATMLSGATPNQRENDQEEQGETPVSSHNPYAAAESAGPAAKASETTPNLGANTPELDARERGPIIEILRDEVDDSVPPADAGAPEGEGAGEEEEDGEDDGSWF